jgi:hypothetical protein
VPGRGIRESALLSAGNYPSLPSEASLSYTPSLGALASALAESSLTVSADAPYATIPEAARR